MLGMVSFSCDQLHIGKCMNVKVGGTQAQGHANISFFPREVPEQEEGADFKLWETDLDFELTGP